MNRARFSFGLSALLPALGLLIPVPACDPGAADLAKDGRLDPLSFQTAAEFAALLATGGEVVCQSGNATLAFAHPGDAVGIPLTLEVGDRVLADTGGDALLDTTLFLFGPDDGSGYFGELPVAMDDDSAGAGRAHLAYTIKDAGDYVLAVSTYKGEGVGQATVQLSVNAAAGCDGGTPTPDCNDDDPCTVDAPDDHGDCMHVADPACNPTTDDVCTTVMTCAQACATDYDCIQTCKTRGCQSAQETSQALLACTFTNCAAMCVANPTSGLCLTCIANFCPAESQACIDNTCSAVTP